MEHASLVVSAERPSNQRLPDFPDSAVTPVQGKLRPERSSRFLLSYERAKHFPGLRLLSPWPPASPQRASDDSLRWPARRRSTEGLTTLGTHREEL